MTLRLRLQTVFFVSVFAFGVARPAASAVLDVQGTIMVAPGGYLAAAGVEYCGGNAGLEVAGNYLAYEYWDGGYYESGDGYLVHGRARYYAQQRADGDRLWVAGGLALGAVDTYWREDGGADYGYETNPLLVITTGAGYKARFANDRLVVDPQILAGVMVGAENPFIVGAGVGVGWRF